MRRYDPPYYSPPRRGYGGRGRSPPRRGYGGRREPSHGSLLVRNIPLNCRPDDLRIPFERFGRVRDVYLPKDYYTGEPRGFAFIEFVDPYDASEAQYHMNGQLFGGRRITVVVAAETRKRPEEMRVRTRARGSSDRDGRRSSHHGRSISRSASRSRSPPRHSRSRSRHRSRSYSPAPRRRDGYSASPERRPSASTKSPRYRAADLHQTDNGYDQEAEYNAEGPHRRRGGGSRSPSGSRSRSANSTPARGR